jgi:hypothetical protein
MDITRPSVPNDTVNDSPCPIDPSLLEENNTSPQEQVPRPKPQRLVGGKRTEDPIARAKARALIALGMPSATAIVQAATVTSATAQVAPATAQVEPATAQVEPATAQVASATARVGTATAESATAAVDSIQNTLQQMTPPSSESTELPHIPSASALARRIRRTADDLAQEEAILNQTVGRRPRIKRVQFAGQ